MVKVSVGGKEGIEYVPRMIPITKDKWVSLEDRISNALEKHGFAYLLGWSGIGKSTTAEYVARTFAEKGYIVVKIVPKDFVEGGIRVSVTPYKEPNKCFVVNVYTSVEQIGSLEKILMVAETIVKVTGDPKKFLAMAKGDEGWFKRVFEKLKRGLEDASDEFFDAVDEFVEVIVPLGFFYAGKEIMKKEEKVGEGLKEVLHFLHEIYPKEVLEFLPFVSTTLGIALSILGIIELRNEQRERAHIHEPVGEIRKVIEKYSRKLLIVVDDIIYASGAGKDFHVLLNFLEHCYKNGCKIFIVRRLDLHEDIEAILEILSNEKGRIWEALALIGHRRHEAFWGIHYEELKECISFLINTSFEEFERIIEVNWEKVIRTRKEKGLKEKLSEEELVEWYKRTSGIPFLALSLMRFMEVSELGEEIAKVGDEYIPKPFFELSKSEAEKLCSTIINAYRELYGKILKEEFFIIPVIFQPIAEDEAREFYDTFSENVRRMLMELRRGARQREGVEVLKEEWVDKLINVYELSSDNAKLRDIFDALVKFDTGVKEDIIEYKHELVRIMTRKFERTGRYTVRMIIHALRHLEFLLKFQENDELYDWYLIWKANALFLLPELGMKDIIGVIRIARNRKSIFALRYLDELARRCKFYPPEEILHVVQRVWEVLREFEVNRESMNAWKIHVESNLLRTETILRIKLKDVSYSSILEKFDKLEREAEKLTSLKNYALAHIFMNKSDILRRLGKLNEAKGCAKKALETLERICFDNIDKNIIEFLKPFGGIPKEIYEVNVKELRASTNYMLGQILRDSMEFKSARNAFKCALEISEEIGDIEGKIKCQSMLRRIDVLEKYVIEYSSMLRGVKKYFSQLDAEARCYLCAECLIWLALEDKLSTENVKNAEFCIQNLKWHPRAEAITLGVLGVLEEELSENFPRKFRLHRKEISIKDNKMISVFLLSTNPAMKKLVNRNIVETMPPVRSSEALAGILWLLLEDRKNLASYVAKLASEFYQNKVPCLSYLFYKLHEALEKDDKEKVKEFLVKLFYYHI